MSTYPLWMQITEACWRIFWKAVGVFLICAAAPAGVLFGLRVLGAIKRVSP